MSTWRRHRAHRNSRASSTAPPGGEGWTIRDHRAILRSEPYACADLGAASDMTAKSMRSEAAPVSPAPAISHQRHSAVIAPAHGDGISGSATSVQVGSTSWAGSPGRFSACSVALRRSPQDLICTIYPHFSVATNTGPSRSESRSSNAGIPVKCSRNRRQVRRNPQTTDRTLGTGRSRRLSRTERHALAIDLRAAWLGEDLGLDVADYDHVTVAIRADPNLAAALAPASSHRHHRRARAQTTHRAGAPAGV